MKGSRNSDFSLVSTKNLFEIFLSSGWGPGPDYLGPNWLKPTSFMRSPTKKRDPKLKFVFIAN